MPKHALTQMSSSIQADSHDKGASDDSHRDESANQRENFFLDADAFNNGKSHSDGMLPMPSSIPALSHEKANDSHRDESSHERHDDGNSHGVGNKFSDAFLHADALYFADITPLNNSGVHGEAILALNGNILTVEVAAAGLDPAFVAATMSNQVHPIHIHGFAPGVPDSMVPTSSADADHDGFIEVAEGAHDYGPILLSLKVDGQFPTAPDGTFAFTETYLLPSPAVSSPIQALNELGLTSDVPLDRREIVIHGLTLNAGQGATNADSILPPVGLNEADGTPGYKIALPVAAGEIQDSHGVSALPHFLAGLTTLGISSSDFHI